MDIVLFGGLYKKILGIVSAIPQIDSGVYVEKIVDGVSGDQATIAVILSKMGLKVGLISNNIGNDYFGDLVINYLEKFEISHRIKKDKKISTPLNFGFSDYKGSKIWFSYSIEIESMLEKIRLDWIINARIMYADAFSYLLPATLRAVSFAHQNDVPCYINLGSHKLIMDILRNGTKKLSTRQARDKMLRIISNSTWIQISMDGLSLKDAKSALKIYQDFGFKILFVTLGKKGAMAITKNKIEYVNAPIIAPRDTAGAGAAFSAGMLYQILKNEDIRISLLYAVATGSLFCEYEDIPKMFSLKLINKFIKHKMS